MRTAPCDACRQHVTSVQADKGVAHLLFGAVQDITERSQVAREVAGHIAMEEVLAAWVTLDEDGGRLLASLGEATGFSVGALWLRRGDALTARSCWMADPSGAYPFDTHLRFLVSQHTRALPVRAWLSRAPVVVVDVAAAPRFVGRDLALAANLHGAVAFPAVSDGDVYGALEFYSRESLHRTETLSRSLAGMGHELGHFFARRRGELQPPELTRREREILKLAADGMSGKAIAHELTLSPSTVKTHLREHLRQVGCLGQGGRRGASTPGGADPVAPSLVRMPRRPLGERIEREQLRQHLEAEDRDRPLGLAQTRLASPRCQVAVRDRCESSSKPASSRCIELRRRSASRPAAVIASR